MINFTNENIQRELKKKKKNVLISLGFTIVFIILIVFFSILEENEKEVNLTEKTSSGTKASLEVFTSPIMVDTRFPPNFPIGSSDCR